jgi:hypothetical protein
MGNFLIYRSKGGSLLRDGDPMMRVDADFLVECEVKCKAVWLGSLFVFAVLMVL